MNTDNSSSQGRRGRFIAVIELAVVAVLVQAVLAFLTEHRMGEQLLNFGINYAFVLNPGEGRLYLLGVLIGLPMVVLLVDASLRLAAPAQRSLLGWASARPRLAVFVLALGAVAATEVLATIFEHTPFLDDEQIYLWQARALLSGHFTTPRPELPQFFLYNFVWMIVTPAGGWASVYPPGGPAMVAVGLLLGAPHLMQLVCVGLIVWVAARFADELWGAEAGVVTAFLLASSPLLTFSATTLHNAIPAALFTIVALRSAWAAFRHGRLRDSVIAPISVAAVFVCRPFDGALVFVPVAVLLVAGLLRPAEGTTRRRRFAGLTVGTMAGVPLIAILLASQWAATGDAFKAPFALMGDLWPGAHQFGFGPSAWGVVHTVDLAFSKLLVVLARINTWTFGLPVALVPPLLLALGFGRDRAATWLLIVLAVHVVGYFFYVAVAVHTMGSYYSLPAVPVLALLFARVTLWTRDRLRSLGERAAALPIRALLALSFTSLLIFSLPELVFLDRVATDTRAPFVAAEQAAKDGPIIAFYRGMQNLGSHRLTSYVYWPPLPTTEMNEPVIWAMDLGNLNPLLIDRLPGRRPMLMDWDKGRPVFVPWTPELSKTSYNQLPSSVPIYALPQPADMVIPEGLSTGAAEKYHLLGTKLRDPQIGN